MGEQDVADQRGAFACLEGPVTRVVAGPSCFVAHWLLVVTSCRIGSRFRADSTLPFKGLATVIRFASICFTLKCVEARAICSGPLFVLAR